MAVIAKLNYLRIAPRKVRLAADSIRGKSVKEARTLLSFIVKKGTNPLLKLLNQAAANAKNNFQLDEDNLYISKIYVDEGPKLKRWRPRSRGQAYEIQKKTSHITIILDEFAAKGKGIKPKSLQSVEKKEQKLVEEKIVKDKKIKPEKIKLRPETEFSKLRTEKGGLKRIFKRKAF